MAARLLLIEDEEYINDIYKEQLQESGFEVDSFLNGAQGIDAFEKNMYDLVLLDIILPDIHGLDILKRFKDNKEKKEVPVVLLTNLDQDIIIRKGLELGAKAYLMKVSCTPDKVVEEVNKILASPAHALSD